MARRVLFAALGALAVLAACSTHTHGEVVDIADTTQWRCDQDATFVTTQHLGSDRNGIDVAVGETHYHLTETSHFEGQMRSDTHYANGPVMLLLRADTSSSPYVFTSSLSGVPGGPFHGCTPE